MNNTTATKILNKANGLVGPESVGFKRYMALPNAVALNLQKAYGVANNFDMTNFTKTIADFFGGMSEVAFRIWLLNQSEVENEWKVYEVTVIDGPFAKRDIMYVSDGETIEDRIKEKYGNAAYAYQYVTTTQLLDNGEVRNVN